LAEGSTRFASRAGEKLASALEGFDLDVSGLTCADFGCNVGGFTDCLLQRGAARVYAVDTGYGALAWTLRKDPRVVVMERTNAMHCPAPELVDLVVIDVAWTPQERIIPAAMAWLRPDADGVVVSLLKPHYERAKMRGGKPRAPLSDTEAGEVCFDVCRRLCDAGTPPCAAMQSSLRGKGGNLEYLLAFGLPKGR
jgi:23S rRNA (cytidine1920-2'-O)/16S rRNA (cytidine1409-2'-O)-methyltransferase